MNASLDFVAKWPNGRSLRSPIATVIPFFFVALTAGDCNAEDRARQSESKSFALPGKALMREIELGRNAALIFNRIYLTDMFGRPTDSPILRQKPCREDLAINIASSGWDFDCDPVQFAKAFEKDGMRVVQLKLAKSNYLASICQSVHSATNDRAKFQTYQLTEERLLELQKHYRAMNASSSELFVMNAWFSYVFADGDFTNDKRKWPSMAQRWLTDAACSWSDSGLVELKSPIED